MGREEFKLAVSGIVTNNGKVLLGKKEENPDRVISGQWHLPGGFVEDGENTEEAVKREIREETGLECDVFQIVEVNYSGDVEIGPEDIYRVVYHLEAGFGDAEPSDDLEDVKWVEPGELEEEFGELETQYMENSGKLRKFIEKLDKAPVF